MTHLILYQNKEQYSRSLVPVLLIHSDLGIKCRPIKKIILILQCLFQTYVAYPAQILSIGCTDNTKYINPRLYVSKLLEMRMMRYGMEMNTSYFHVTAIHLLTSQPDTKEYSGIVFA